jgi:hypothetical protein
VKHLFKHKLIVYSTEARNEYNEESYSGAAEYYGRFQLKNKLITNPQGESIMADAVIYMDKEATSLSIGTKVEYSSQAYRVIGLEESLNDLGNREFYKVWLQRWEA